MHHMMHAWYPWRTEKGIRCLEMELQIVMYAETQTVSSGEAASDITTESSLQPQ